MSVASTSFMDCCGFAIGQQPVSSPRVVNANRLKAFVSCCLTVVASLLVAGSHALGQSSTASPDVLAWVGTQPITQADVDRQLGRIADARLPALPHAAQQNAVRLIALQRQALQTLRKLKLAADGEEVERWIASQVDAAAGKLQPSDTDSYRELVAFRLSWKRYLSRHLTEENLARHFKNQQPRFDGTRFKIVRVSASVPAGKSADRDVAAESMAELARQVIDEPLELAAFQEAARDQGWQVSQESWVRGSGSLEPQLIGGLLKMKQRQVSTPIHTAGGVHLVWLLEREPGDRDLDEVRDEVRAHMLVFLLEHLASQSSQQLPLSVTKPSP